MPRHVEQPPSLSSRSGIAATVKPRQISLTFKLSGAGLCGPCCHLVSIAAHSVSPKLRSYQKLCPDCTSRAQSAAEVITQFFKRPDDERGASRRSEEAASHG
jgi:hypothetical protein